MWEGGWVGGLGGGGGGLNEVLESSRGGWVGGLRNEFCCSW